MHRWLTGTGRQVFMSRLLIFLAHLLCMLLQIQLSVPFALSLISVHISSIMKVIVSQELLLYNFFVVVEASVYGY